MGLSYNLGSCVASALTMVGLGVHNNPGGVVGTQACVLQWMVVYCACQALWNLLQAVTQHPSTQAPARPVLGS